MKSFTKLFERIVSFENLLLALRRAAKHNRRRHACEDFELHREERLLDLQHQLEDGTYRPGAYHTFFIHEPKKRLISAAPFADRVVQHAVCNVIEPLLSPSFIDDSYACMLGRGTHRACNRFTALSRRYSWVLLGVNHYGSMSEKLSEIGRMIGGWRKTVSG
ncbi:MAG: hypothetical protein V2A73_22960 [Pseudomonadota bacterium]